MSGSLGSNAKWGVASALNGVRASGSRGVIYCGCQLVNLMRREILLEVGPNKANVARDKCAMPL